MTKITWVIFVISLCITGWIGWGAYHYFFDRTPPVLMIEGLDTGEWYAGDIQGLVNGKDDYKIHDVSLWLDGKPLINSGKINRKQFEYPFPIPTKNLSHGMHTLKVIVRDASYAGNEATQELTFGVDNIPLQAAFIKSDSDLKVFQGRTLHLQFQVNKPIKEAVVKTLSSNFYCFPETTGSLVYECFIPIRSEEVPNEYLFSIELTDRVGNMATLENKFQVVMYPFKKQKLVLNADKVKEENSVGLSEAQLEKDCEEATQKSPKKKLWQGSFYVPLDLRGISTEFGTIRVTQERGKYQHNAVDLLSAPKSVIWAPQDGIIVIKNRYAHSGNTLVIDHGYGILSLFFHLDNFANVHVGDKIKKGNPLGTLGMTGYASGYHLHWEMRVMMIPIDPMQWTKHDF